MSKPISYSTEYAALGIKLLERLTERQRRKPDKEQHKYTQMRKALRRHPAKDADETLQWTGTTLEPARKP